MDEDPHAAPARTPQARVDRLWAGLSLVVLCGGAWLLWVRFNEGLSRRGSTAPADFLNYYVPMTELAGDRLAAGQLPLWNDLACSGIPFLATLQTAVFYPPTWLAAVVPAHPLLSALAFAHVLLGGIGAALLFRAWRCPWLPAVLGALVYLRAGPLGQTLWPPAAATLGWLPWVALCTDRIVRGGSVGWWLGLVGGLALQLLAGYPQLMLYGLAVCGVVALAAALAERRRGVAVLARRAGLLGAAGLLAAGLAGVQLAPTAELIALGPRAEQLSPDAVHYLTPEGRHTSASDVLGNLTLPRPSRLMFDKKTGYLGAAVVPLALAGLLARRREPLPWALLAAGALGLVLSDGYRGPWPGLYELYAGLPVFGSLRTPERLRIIPYLAAAALAAMGAAALWRGGARRTRLLHAAACAAGGLVFVVAWRVGVGSLGGAIFGSLAAGLGVAAALPARGRLREAVLLVLLLGHLWDLRATTAAVTWIRHVPPLLLHTYNFPGVVLPPARFEELRRQVGDARMEILMLPLVASPLAGRIERPSCYEPLMPEQWAALHQRLIGADTTGRTLFERGLAEGTFYDVASVRGSVRLVFGVPVFEPNLDALPRAYFVTDYQVAERAEVFDHVANGDFDFHGRVLLDRAPVFPPRPGGPLRPLARRTPRPERVEIDFTSREPGLVVLTDTWYAGWTATVDGEETDILLANGLYRAVAVPAGRHEVVFEYRPRSFAIGAALSGLSALLLLAVAWTWGRAGTVVASHQGNGASHDHKMEPGAPDP